MAGPHRCPIPPWASSTEGEKAVLDEARALVGARVAAVAYLQGEHFYRTLTEQPGPRRFDFADVGIEITTGDGRVFAGVWKPAVYEALSFGPGGGELHHGIYPLRRIDVGAWESWSTLLGAEVGAVELIWHYPTMEPVRCVRGVDLDLDGRHVLVALGTPDGQGGIEYLHDEVVVVFDEELAREYRTTPAH